MNDESLLEVLKRIDNASYAKKTDKKLVSDEILSEMYKNRNKGVQPPSLAKYNSPRNRKCKLTIEQVEEIRKKYNPWVYGKQKLAAEYGVSKSVVYRILQGKSWKKFEN